MIKLSNECHSKQIRAPVPLRSGRVNGRSDPTPVP